MSDDKWVIVPGDGFEFSLEKVDPDRIGVGQSHWGLESPHYDTEIEALKAHLWTLQRTKLDLGKAIARTRRMIAYRERK